MTRSGDCAITRWARAKVIAFTGACMVVACSTRVAEPPRHGIGITVSNLDSTVSPAQDLFRFANGTWLTQTRIPDELGSWSAFREVQDRNDHLLLEALRKIAAGKEYLEGSDQRMAADFFEVGMDSLLAEQSGLTPVQDLLQRVDKLTNKNELSALLADDDLRGGSAFFSLSVQPDRKHNNRMAAYIEAGGLGLPERDFYLRQDPRSQEIRAAYVSHMSQLLTLAGWDANRSAIAAARIVGLETDLAQVTLSKEDSRDPSKQYNKVVVSELPALAHSISWPDYLNLLMIKQDSLIVTQPAFLRGVDRVMTIYPLDDLKAYLRWTILREAAPYLGSSFVTASFDFRRKLLGTKSQAPRWRRVLETANANLGDAMGKLYVAQAFSADARVKALEMVEDIRLSFADRIKNLTWMSDSTKVRALSKLKAMTVKVGYPDKWQNYAGLTILKAGKGSYYGNIRNAMTFRIRKQIDKLGQPVDRSVWPLAAQDVNAFYNPQFNEIVFPAGILQPPFYDVRADEPVNYGGIGAAIGHEISHGFDDEGSQYDADGNLINWWSADDLRRFREKGKALADQFSKYQPLPGINLQGQFTLGENMGDLGGLQAAYDGLHRHLRESNSPAGKMDNLTADQRFFISWATIWRVKFRDEALRTYVLTNSHSPGMYRANGPPSNMQAFYDAFGVKKGDGMFREENDRIVIW